MSDPKPDSTLIAKIHSIVEYLKTESQYLDTVIESSLEMQSILRERRSLSSSSSEKQSATEKSGLQAELDQRLNDRMAQLRAGIEKDFLPIAEGRMQLVGVLKTIDPTADKTPSLTELATQVEEPLRSNLKSLRQEIRGKLNQIHSISMGNQAVLLYTLDFYNRLLAGLSTDDQQSSYYNASGRSQNHIAGSLVQTKC